MTFKYTNNAVGALNTSLTPSATTFTLNSGQGSVFPVLVGNDAFMITLVDATNSSRLEIVRCIGRAGDTFTVIRGQEGTTAQAFNVNDTVSHRLTAQEISNLNTAPNTVTSISNLRALDKTIYNNVVVTGYYTPGDGGGGEYYFDPTDSTSTDNKGTVIVAADGGRWKLAASTDVSMRQFGAIGDGVTDDTSSITAANTWISTTLISGNKVKLRWPSGRYLQSTSPNWAITRLDLEFSGEVWIINTGTGVTFNMDGGATGAGVYGLKIKGYPLIYGGSGSSHGVYMRAVQRSHIEINVRGAGGTSSGLFMQWCVSNTMFYIMNVNEGGLYNIPAIGLTLTSRAFSEQSSYNTFINVECSGMPIGIYEDGSLGNLFIGGAVQACTNYGLQQTVNAFNNKFLGTDFEVNTNGDIQCNGEECQFIGCDLATGIEFQSGAIDCSLMGGATQSILIDSGAARTLLSGVTFNRFGSGTLTDNSASTRYRDLRDKANGIVENVPRVRVALTVAGGSGSFSYTNAGSNEESVMIYGGLGVLITLTRFSGDPLGLAAGQFTLSPGDTISCTFTAGSPPSAIKWTR